MAAACVSVCEEDPRRASLEREARGLVSSRRARVGRASFSPLRSPARPPPPSHLPQRGLRAVQLDGRLDHVQDGGEGRDLDHLWGRGAWMEERGGVRVEEEVEGKERKKTADRRPTPPGRRLARTEPRRTPPHPQA